MAEIRYDKQKHPGLERRRLPELKWVGKVRKPKGPVRRVNDLMRRHLYTQCLSMKEVLTKAWEMKYSGVHMRMARNDPWLPWHVERFCEAVGLSPEERKEMHLLAAREWGWDV